MASIRILPKALPRANTSDEFDLFNLPIGDYRLEFKNEQEKQVKTFSITSDKGKRILHLE